MISVGNLTLGGTGKTPVVEYISRFFINKGLKPVVITRGYGRSSPSSIAIVSDGKKILLKPDEAGDEPYLMAENIPSLPVIVGKNRFRAGERAIEQFNPDLIILDDGFQHMSLARDLNIVLLNCIRPLRKSHIFPAGTLREPISALNRADIVLYTHSEESSDNGQENFHIRKNDLKIKTIHTFDKIVRLKDQETRSPDELNGKKVVIFCGIGEPDSFRKKVEQHGAEVVYFKSYPDHYEYKSDDLLFLHKSAEKLNADYILTTQKDSVKIKDKISNFPLIWSVLMRIEFKEGEKKFQEALIFAIKVQ